MTNYIMSGIRRPRSRSSRSAHGARSGQVLRVRDTRAVGAVFDAVTAMTSTPATLWGESRLADPLDQEPLSLVMRRGIDPPPAPLCAQKLIPAR